MKEARRKGISIKKLNYIMGALGLVVAIALLFVSYRAFTLYDDVQKSSDNYFIGEKSANELQASSDYLTEQVRSFAGTGVLLHLENYFEETEVVQRRENALRELAEHFKDSKAYESLENAMNES